ncbi:hypothetical protein PtB15_10B100 [Puccinia triticina]|nr:hypothetical protein PtB15_10B100 [Puccinia triticina]
MRKTLYNVLILGFGNPMDASVLMYDRQDAGGKMYPLGGIYTVIKTKAPINCHKYGDQYCLLGPLAYKSAPMEVEAIKPDTPEMRDSLQSMKDCGVKYLYRCWLIEGGPKVLLFDTGSMMSCLDKWKNNLWNLAGIPAPPNNSETNDMIVFGYLVACFLGEFASCKTSKAIIGHFHKWLAGLAIPLCRKRQINITTIFTTHTTLLGCYLCAGSVDFYNNIQYFDVNHKAGKRGIYHRYCVKWASTHCANEFPRRPAVRTALSAK